MAENRQRGLLRVASEVPIARPSRESLDVRIPSSGGEKAALAAASAYGDIERELAGLGETIGKYADHAAAVEGAREGHQAGLDPEFRPRRDNTIRGEAYDRAGLETYRSTVAIEIENDIAKGGDLGKKREAWLAQVPDELRPEVTHQFRRAELTQARAAAREAAARVAGEAVASLQEELDTQIRTLHQRAYTLGLDATADQTLATDIGLIGKALQRTGPDGTPLVPPATAAKILRNARETVVDARLLGAFDRQQGTEAKARFLEQFEDDWKHSRGLAQFYDLRGFQRMAGQLRSGLSSEAAIDRQRVAALREDMKQVQSAAEKGYAPTPEQLAGLKARAEAAGDPALTERLALIEDVSTFQMAARKSPPAAIEAYAASLRDDIRQNGPSEAKIARVEMAERLANEARAALKTDPLGWADRVGFVKVAPIDLSSEETAAATLKARIVQAEDVAAHFHAEQTLYLRPEEKRQLATIAAGGGANLMGIASTLARAAGARAPAILGEIFTEAPVVAALGSHVAAVGPTSVAQDVADGIALRKTEGYKPRAPEPKKARELALAAHGGALNGWGATEQALISATNAAYEAQAQRNGWITLSEDKWKEYFRALLGERTINGTVYGGVAPGRPGMLWGGEGAVIVPANVKRDGFRDLFRSIRLPDFGDNPPRYADGRTVVPSDLARAQLVQAGAGRYLLNIGDVEAPRWLVDGERRPFVLDMNALEPTLKARRGDLYLDGAPRGAEGGSDVLREPARP